MQLNQSIVCLSMIIICFLYYQLIFYIIFQNVVQPQQPQEISQDAMIEEKVPLQIEEEVQVMDVEPEVQEEVPPPEESRPPTPPVENEMRPVEEQPIVTHTEFSTKSPLKWTVIMLNKLVLI